MALRRKQNKTINMVKSATGSYVASKAVATAGTSLSKTVAKKGALTALKAVAGKAIPVVAGAALAYGAYTAADKYLFKGKLPLGAKNEAAAMGQRKYRRINPLNYKAASRATKRIKGAMDMLKKIEKQLPKQKVKVSPGVITRAEMSRALAR